MLSYELIVWPVDRAMTTQEASAEVEHLASGFQVGLRRDHRLDEFVDTVEERWPGLRKSAEMERPFEFDIMRHHVFVGVTPVAAEEVLAIVAEAAWSTGLAVFDPQRQLVGLPAPFADGPLGTEGVGDLVRAAAGSEDAESPA